MVANFIPLIMQGASDTMGILNKLFGGGGSSYNSDSARAAKWQHNYNLAAMKQAQKYTLDQMAKSYNYNARGVALQNKYNVQNMGKQYNYNLALQKQAQNFEAEQYAQRYQKQVEDLKKAGINPLYGLGTAPALASSGSSVGLPNSGAPSASGGMSPLGSGLADLAGENNSKRLFKLNRLKTHAEVAQMLYQNSALKAETEKTKQETETEKINTLMKEEEKEGIKLDNIRKKLENKFLPKKIKNELKIQEKQIENYITMIKKQKTDIQVNGTLAEKNNAETAVKKALKENIITKTQIMKNTKKGSYKIKAGKLGDFGYDYEFIGY